MKTIFLGFFFDQRKEQELLQISKIGIPTASNQYQNGFLEGGGQEVDIISILPVGTYPKWNKRLYIHREMQNTKWGRIHYLPFINFYGIKEVMQFTEIYKTLASYISDNARTVIYVYSLYMPFLHAIRRLKKKFDNIHCILIVPDLPGKYGIMRRAVSLGGIRDRFEAKQKMKFVKYADAFVFLTEQMKDLFPPRPYTVIEGFLPQCSFDNIPKRIPKSILYTGSLNKAFGIEKLLNAFLMINDKDFQLWICGAGGEQAVVEDYVKRDPRIKYYGFVSKEKIVQLQTACEVLVNPRPNADAFTKYSFPSKTMEYLLSGSKVVMYRLAGVPAEYYDYIYMINGDRLEDLKDTLINACSDESFYRSKSSLQIEWIKNRKNAVIQCQKLENIYSELGRLS